MQPSFVVFSIAYYVFVKSVFALITLWDCLNLVIYGRDGRTLLLEMQKFCKKYNNYCVKKQSILVHRNYFADIGLSIVLQKIQRNFIKLCLVLKEIRHSYLYLFCPLLTIHLCHYHFLHTFTFRSTFNGLNNLCSGDLYSFLMW